MENKCPHADLCGGCQLQGLSYTKQLQYKQEKIEKLLSKFHKVNKIIGMNDPFNYRNKIQVSFGLDDSHNVIYGNYIPSTHLIVPIKECMISDNLSLEILEYIKSLVIKYKINIFDEVSLKGCLRHVQIRCSNSNEYMVIFVTGTSRLIKADLIVKDLINKFKCIKTIVLNINCKHTSMVLGDSFYTLYGKGYIRDELCNLKFDLSCSSFYQVNKRQTEILYNIALNLVDLKGNEKAIDAYCGIGTITLNIAKRVKEVIGVEINKQAIKDGIHNAKLNKINNALFYADDASHFMNKLAKEKEHIDFVCMDPPRTGADEKFLNSLCRLKPSKILYISCGPESLRNNLKYLIKNGYKIEVIQPVDMFPYTNHVETVVLMSRN